MSGWCGHSGTRSSSGGGFDGDDPNVSTVNIFNEISSVPKLAETDIINFTVAPTIRFVLHRVEFTGANIAKYKLYIGGVAQAINQTWFNGDMSSFWDFSAPGNSGLKVPSGVSVRVTVIHTRPDPAYFAAQVHGVNIQE